MFKQILNTVCCVLLALLLDLLLGINDKVYAEQNVVAAQELGSSKAATVKVELSKKAQYTVNAKILIMLELANRLPAAAERKVAKYQQNVSPINVAEQYLLLLIQAKIKQHYRQYQQAIDLLEQAKPLAENITEQQLYLPVFADLHLTLAQNLAAINDFEKAYQTKKYYIEKLNDYSEAKRDKTVALLTKKYEIAHKTETNELLDNESKLKALQLGDVKKYQTYQQRNFILIFCGILVFILLFLRQFKVRKKLLLLSKTDSLTKLLNRSALFIEGQTLVKNTLEQQQELSVLLFDIDHFKAVNDDYGHQAGDLVLVKIASLVNETMRARDIFARLGGEEFVILLPDTDVDKAKAIAVRVIEKISQYDFNHLGIHRAITLSIGVANIKDTAAVFDDILHAADLAMYQAKQQGRNQMINYATISDDQERRVN